MGQGLCPVRCGPQVRPAHLLRANPQAVSKTWLDVGLLHRSSCSTFRPRPSGLRLCRKARSQLLSCTATSAAQPIQPAQPTAIHRAAATILSFWQHSLKQVAGFVRRQPTQMDSAVCKQHEAVHVHFVLKPRDLSCEMQEINAQIRSSIKNMKCLAAVAPLAAISASGSTNTFILITNAVGSFIRVCLHLALPAVIKVSQYPRVHLLLEDCRGCFHVLSFMPVARQREYGSLRG